MVFREPLLNLYLFNLIDFINWTRNKLSYFIIIESNNCLIIIRND